MSPGRKHWLWCCWIKGGFVNRRGGVKFTLDRHVGGEGRQYALWMITNALV